MNLKIPYIYAYIDTNIINTLKNRSSQWTDFDEMQQGHSLKLWNLIYGIFLTTAEYGFANTRFWHAYIFSSIFVIENAVPREWLPSLRNINESKIKSSLIIILGNRYTAITLWANPATTVQPISEAKHPCVLLWRAI